MRELKSLLAAVVSAALWPVYFVALAYTARQAPWPRGLGMASASALAVFALLTFLANVSRGLLRDGGWFETVLHFPAPVAKQINRALLCVLAAGGILLLPAWLLSQGLILNGGRPVFTPTLCRSLELVFQLTVWVVVYLLVRGRSPLVEWLLQFPDRLGWLNRRRRTLAYSLLAAIAALIALDARGFRYTARRLESGAAQFFCVVLLCWGARRLLLKAIDKQAWRWIRPGHPAATASAEVDATDDSGQPTDLAGRLRRLTGYLVPLLGVFLTAWAWDLDLALFRTLGEQTLLNIGKEGKETLTLTLGDLTEAVVVLTLTAAAWRHLSTFFALAVFPRMPDDPGVRFAVLTLCRYALLAAGILTSLSAVHLGFAQIGVVLAALGVGLGFGLQEIVSNFVCGIILLLERPIRVGDVVTVAGMSGKVDRINIRATTITNGDNQSMIIPNRAFITGDLINWTLKDKIIRASIRVKVAHGTDPDRVTELLLNIAREDADVLRNPVPSALMEDFSDSALAFALFVHVPEPSLSGRVRHRLLTQIQKRFQEAGIEIPLPTQEFHLKPAGEGSGSGYPPWPAAPRMDAGGSAPNAPHRFARPLAQGTVEETHRGIDE